MYLCFIVGDSGLNQPCNSATLPWDQIQEQLGSFIPEFSLSLLMIILICCLLQTIRRSPWDWGGSVVIITYLLKGIISLDAGSGKVLRQ